MDISLIYNWLLTALTTRKQGQPDALTDRQADCKNRV